VQNKLIWAISKQTVAKFVYSRVNGKLPQMDMKSLGKTQSSKVTKQDVTISKND